LKIFFELTSIFLKRLIKKIFQKTRQLRGALPPQLRGLDILRGLKILLCEFKPRLAGKKVWFERLELQKLIAPLVGGD